MVLTSLEHGKGLNNNKAMKLISTTFTLIISFSLFLSCNSTNNLSKTYEELVKENRNKEPVEDSLMLGLKFQDSFQKTTHTIDSLYKIGTLFSLKEFKIAGFKNNPLSENYAIRKRFVDSIITECIISIDTINNKLSEFEYIGRSFLTSDSEEKLVKYSDVLQWMINQYGDNFHELKNKDGETVTYWFNGYIEISLFHKVDLFFIKYKDLRL